MEPGTPAPTLTRRLQALYAQLLQAYGPQGWWPTPGRAGARGFTDRGYHPGDYTQPRTPEGRFEIVTGAILTQNTAWTNVEKAFARLQGAGIRRPSDLLAVPTPRLARLIRASGYFNQKARKLKGIAELFSTPRALTLGMAPTRTVLLSQWGVGPETADSILLYAFQVPVFVVDAYTRRLLERIGLAAGAGDYEGIQETFHRSLPRNHQLFNEFHALIVHHAKIHCRARPICNGCPVVRCRYRDAAHA
jgi:endonuclease III related protein